MSSQIGIFQWSYIALQKGMEICTRNSFGDIFKLYCRNISALSDSTFNLFLYFVQCGSHQSENLPYFLLWGEWQITVKSYTVVSVTRQYPRFQNIWSASGLPENWWTVHHLVLTARHQLAPTRAEGCTSFHFAGTVPLSPQLLGAVTSTHIPDFFTSLKNPPERKFF